MWQDGKYFPLPQCPDPAVIWIKQSVDCRLIDQATQATDAIHLAAQVGRLDVVSAVLALFGLLIGLAAIFGFIEVRNRAKEAATEVAKSVAREVAREEGIPEARRAALDWLQSSGIDWQKLAALAPVSEDGDQRFADALNDEENANGNGTG